MEGKIIDRPFSPGNTGRSRKAKTAGGRINLYRLIPFSCGYGETDHDPRAKKDNEEPLSLSLSVGDVSTRIILVVYLANLS